MGAVHGVILKYVGLTAVATATHLIVEADSLKYLALYVAVANFFVTLGFLVNGGTSLIGKSSKTGTLPWWSYIVWGGFIGPTWLYTALHTWAGKHGKGVKEADEVFPGWWLGSRYADVARERPEKFARISAEIMFELLHILFSDSLCRAFSKL